MTRDAADQVVRALEEWVRSVTDPWASSAVMRERCRDALLVALMRSTHDPDDEP